MELIETIREMAVRTHVASFSDAKKINSMEAYLSWFPGRPDGEQFSSADMKVWEGAVKTDDKELAHGKKMNLRLFDTRSFALKGDT